MAIRELSPIEAFEYTLTRWWLVAVLTVLGGSLGWAFQRSQPPIYEARVLFTVGIDFKEAGQLSQYEEDLAIGVAGAVIGSTPVMEQVIEAASARNIPIDLASLSHNSTVERKQAIWQLRLLDRDPDTAALLANIWAERAYEALVKAHQHARRADQLKLFLNAYNACLNFEELEPENLEIGQVLEQDTELCQGLTLSDVKNQYHALEEQLSQELMAGKGMLPSLVFDLSQKAVVPEKPVAYQANLLVMAGALLGFLVGVVLATARGPRS